jgi:hypothetical protein
MRSVVDKAAQVKFFSEYFGLPYKPFIPLIAQQQQQQPPPPPPPSSSSKSITIYHPGLVQ